MKRVEAAHGGPIASRFAGSRWRYKVLITGLVCSFAAAFALYRASVNYEEARVPSYTLPDPLRMEDGRPVTDAAMWITQRRPELLRLFEAEVYGRWPSAPQGLTFRVIGEDVAALDGQAIRREVRGEFGGGGGKALTITLFAPRLAGPAPVFAGVQLLDANEAGSAQAATVRRILARGYGVASVNVDELAADTVDPSPYARRLLGAVPPASANSQETGKIGQWAWALSRALDYLRTDPAVDPHRVFAMGHSRMGKSALWAGAHDERFAMVISNESGHGGAALGVCFGIPDRASRSGFSIRARREKGACP